VNELAILQHSTTAKIVAYFRIEGVKALAFLGMHVVCLLLRALSCSAQNRLDALIDIFVCR
jgi:hypothetical protein